MSRKNISKKEGIIGTMRGEYSQAGKSIGVAERRQCGETPTGRAVRDGVENDGVVLFWCHQPIY